MNVNNTAACTFCWLVLFIIFSAAVPILGDCACYSNWACRSHGMWWFSYDLVLSFLAFCHVSSFLSGLMQWSAVRLRRSPHLPQLIYPNRSDYIINSAMKQEKDHSKILWLVQWFHNVIWQVCVGRWVGGGSGAEGRGGKVWVQNSKLANLKTWDLWNQHKVYLNLNKQWHSKK